jgi:hypothetical protein
MNKILLSSILFSRDKIDLLLLLQVRLPEIHLDLAGDTVHIYETYYKGRRMFLLAPDDGFDGEITQTLGNSTEIITQSPNNSELESRVNV